LWPARLTEFKGGFGAVFTTILLLVVCQAGIAHPSARLRTQTPQVSIAAPAIPDFPDEAQGDEAAYAEHEFVRHLNGLLQVLNDFSATYKAGFVDVKKVKAVRKALHDLEKSEWFKPQRTADGDKLR
jgi:hypothetical protein